MTEQSRPDRSRTDRTEESDVGVPEFQRTPGKAEGEDPTNPESKPQGTLEDRAKNMDAEGHLVEPPSAEAG